MQDENSKKLNLAIAVMRIICCYGVVAAHFGPRLFFSGYAVPVFMILAFYFWHVNDSAGLGKRMLRIAIPFFFWGCVGVVLRAVHESHLDWRWVVLQCSLGVCGNSPLWFLSMIMFNTILIYACLHLPLIRKFSDEILVLLVIVCIGMQYAQAIGRLSTCVDLMAHVEIVIGRFFECFPFAVVGYYFGVGNRMGFRAIRTPIVMLCSVVSVLCVGIYLCGWTVENEFGYAGVGKLIICSCVTYFVAFLGPFVRGVPHNLELAIIMMSSFTPGIYYIHKLVGSVAAMFVAEGFMESYPMTIVVFVGSLGCVLSIKRINLLKSVVR